ncbi:MAG: glutamate-5-semialdehyde dehydrogenase [Clostridiales bacterium]|nr:glutamate-5-semialdehyde dehydrogenase [Clostridiales bacterium]
MTYLETLGFNAVTAEKKLASAGTDLKNRALKNIADALRKSCDMIIAANGEDVKRGRENGMSESLIDRLSLTKARIESMAKGAEDVAAAADPVGKVLWGEKRPNGLDIQKVSVPIGVIAVIFEARPNVTSDAAALCLKAGNAVILRGGKEALSSNKAISDVMRGAIAEAGLPEDCIQFVTDTSHEGVNELMKMNEYIDLLIPRGGARLINAVVKGASVPVIQTGVGNCHVYVDKFADVDMAANIVFNAKTSRPSVCNACESLIIHKDIAEKALPLIKARLDEKNVEIRGDEAVCAVLKDAVPASDDDWGREYLDYIISVKTVGDIDEAIAHIAKYGTGHSEAIVTDNYASAKKFTSEVDAAAVYVNASTRFTDGGEFGFGAEIGISTQKLHARGPVGLDKLTSEKFIVLGSGQVR